MATWGSVATWNFATWNLGSGTGATWGDPDTWGQLNTWWDTTVPTRVVSVTGLDLDEGTITALDRVTSTMRPLAAVRATMRAVGSDGASIGPATAVASGVSITEHLAPAQRIVEIVAVHPGITGYQLTVSPTDVFPPTGLPVLYSATQPTYTAGPFLWVTTDGDLYLVEP